MTTPTPEAIEAAAKSMAEFNHWDWADLADGYQTSWHKCAENMLTAALPFIAAPLEAEIAALRKAAHIGVELDNHHNADRCPYCTPATVAAQAKAEALREAAEVLEQLDRSGFGSPEIDGYADIQAVASGGTIDWLRARAATIEGKDS